MTLILGVDVGTQGARAVTCDLAGVVHSEATVDFGVTATDTGGFEQDPRVWRRTALGVIHSAVASLAEQGIAADRIAALSVTSTSGTLCLVDAQGQPVRPAIMYSDTRSSEIAHQVQEAGAQTAAKLGIRYSASYALSKLRWVQRHDPKSIEKARWFLSPTDLVIGWLSGQWGRTDWTNALKWGYDVVDLCWPEFIWTKLDMPHKFPRVEAPGTVIGQLSAEAAKATGLSQKTLVVAGSTDGTASQLASGAFSPGDWNSTLGTTLVLKGVSETLLRDPQGRIYSHRHPDGYWLPGGASSTGADCLAKRFQADQLAALNAGALSASPTELVVYPLTRRGERFPFARPDATGFIIGETQDQVAYYAAHLEGLAYVERLAFEVLDDLGAKVGDILHVAGGATRSLASLQIRADVLGKQLQVPDVPLGAMGAAILAAKACGFERVADAAKAMVHYRQTVEPRSPFRQAYEAPYDRFLQACRDRGYL